MFFMLGAISYKLKQPSVRKAVYVIVVIKQYIEKYYRKPKLQMMNFYSIENFGSIYIDGLLGTCMQL